MSTGVDAGSKWQDGYGVSGTVPRIGFALIRATPRYAWVCFHEVPEFFRFHGVQGRRWMYASHDLRLLIRRPFPRTILSRQPNDLPENSLGPIIPWANRGFLVFLQRQCSTQRDPQQHNAVVGPVGGGVRLLVHGDSLRPLASPETDPSQREGVRLEIDWLRSLCGHRRESDRCSDSCDV